MSLQAAAGEVQRFRGARFFAAYLMTMAFSAFANQAGAQMRAVDLGTLGGANSSAHAMNASGQVVGVSDTAKGLQHAFSWTVEGGMIDLGTLGGFYSYASAVNASGQVVGQSSTADGYDHAFSWTAAGGMIDLGSLGGNYSYATAVNASGVIVGQSSPSEQLYRAFSWTAATGMTAVGPTTAICCDGSSTALQVNARGQVVGVVTSDGSSDQVFVWTAAEGTRIVTSSGSSQTAINDNGQIVGWGPSSDGDWAFSWTAKTGTIDLGTLGGHSSYASDVNATGQVVGGSALAGDTTFHAFSWTATGGMIDLGIPGSNNGAVAVNASGQVVGYSSTVGDTVRRAFSWTAAAGMIDLGTLPGFSYSEVIAVNDAGQIVGSSRTTSVRRATMWQPVATHSLRPVADTYARAGVWQATNFGAAGVLTAKKGISQDTTRRSYLKFEIGGIGTVGYATLRLYGHLSNVSTVEAQTTVYAVNDVSWDERTLTWNTRPDLGAVVGKIIVSGTTPQWFTVDVTGLVRAEQQAGHTVIGLALRNVVHSSAYAEFSSRESGSLAPQLLIMR